MEALKKRSNAITIAIIVIIAATFMGMVRSANSAAKTVERQFYNGVYLAADKYTEPSIQQQLDKRALAALGLLTVLNTDEALTAEVAQLRTARELLLEAETIPDKYAANEKLETAWKQLFDALKARGSDIPASVDSYTATLRGAQGAIDNNHYNDMTEQFDTEMAAFPIGLIRMIGLINLPDAFGG